MFIVQIVSKNQVLQTISLQDINWGTFSNFLTYIFIIYIICSNFKNVVRSRAQNGFWQYNVIHWRTDNIKTLYETFCLQHPALSECEINYFAKFIPPFVRKRK